MNIDAGAVFAKIKELAVTDSPVGAKMLEIIRVCSSSLPHASWEAFANLDYDADVASLVSWIPDTFKASPAPFPIRGLWIGLCNPCTSETDVWADMYAAAMGSYDSANFDWLWDEKRHDPKPKSYSRSSSLKVIYKLAYVDSGLGNDAEWPLCWAFGAFATCQLLRTLNPSSIGSNADIVGVVVGFDGGDMLRIGELTANGFRADPKA